ncbi:MAG: adenosylcobinamide-GDP ribazoletransferase [Methanomicrobiales archaeon]|nr:adenosylcobinamide-GDP ribazoletransferase [Methanomicrobiales archaeon]
MLQVIRALLQFTTIIPLGNPAPFESFARNTWIYPLSGYVTGGIAGVLLYFLPVPDMVRAVLAIGMVFFLTGANHLDGLLDFGDGLMAHGSREKRLSALTDRQIGTGGIAIGMIVTILSISSLGSIHNPLIAASTLILAETGAKWGMAFLTITGKPFHEGIHATFHHLAKPWFIIPASLILVPAFLFPFSNEARVLALIILVSVPFFIRWLAYRLFGGVNGDVTGATGEICRSVIITAISCCLM